MVAQAPPKNSGNVTVVCRFRPFNQKEKDMGTEAVVDFKPDKQKIFIKLDKVSSHDISPIKIWLTTEWMRFILTLS